MSKIVGFFFSFLSIALFVTPASAAESYCSFQNPVEGATISHPFYSTPKHLNNFRPHPGVDLAITENTPVKAAEFGLVINVSKLKVGHKPSRLAIIHADGTKTVYKSLSKFSVKEGDFVAKGQIIGLSGGVPDTKGAGWSSGPHIHFRVMQDGKFVDPSCVVL